MTSFNNIDEIKQAWLDGSLDGILSGVNEKHNNVIITFNDQGFYIITTQDNGWIRTNEYLYDSECNTWIHSETYTK